MKLCGEWEWRLLKEWSCGVGVVSTWDEEEEDAGAGVRVVGVDWLRDTRPFGRDDCVYVCMYV